MYRDCGFYYLVQFDGKSMVEVQLTGYQFRHYFFMRLLSINTKCYWHITNTAKVKTVLLFYRYMYFNLFSIICICTCNWFMYPCNSLWEIHKSTSMVILLTLIAVSNVSRPYRVDRLNDFSLTFTKRRFWSRVRLSNYDTVFDLQDRGSNPSGVCLAIETTRIP